MNMKHSLHPLPPGTKHDDAQGTSSEAAPQRFPIAKRKHGVWYSVASILNIWWFPTGFSYHCGTQTSLCIFCKTWSLGCPFLFKTQNREIVPSASRCHSGANGLLWKVRLKVWDFESSQHIPWHANDTPMRCQQIDTVSKAGYQIATSTDHDEAATQPFTSGTQLAQITWSHCLTWHIHVIFGPYHL